MSNPFSNIELKHWPDFVLAISGISFVMVLAALISSTNLPGGTLGWVTLMAGVVCFGIAGKHAHYRRHDKDIHKWISAWRMSVLSNILVVIAFGLISGSVYIFVQNS